LTTCPHINLS